MEPTALPRVRLPLVALLGAEGISWGGNALARVAVPWFVLEAGGSAKTRARNPAAVSGVTRRRRADITAGTPISDRRLGSPSAGSWTPRPPHIDSSYHIDGGLRRGVGQLDSTKDQFAQPPLAADDGR